MGAAIVVIVAPSAERLARMGEIVEDFFVKELGLRRQVHQVWNCAWAASHLELKFVSL